MKLHHFIPVSLLFFLFACGEAENTEEVTTGNLMEIEPGQEELDEIALSEQPELIQDFFAIDQSIIGDDFCYDYSSVSQLILHDNTEAGEWTQFEVTGNYLTIHNSECDVMLEFMIIGSGDEKQAFLSQMNKGTQQFNYLVMDGEGNWKDKSNYPKPTMDEYFSNLSPEEYDLVIDYGTDFIYINPGANSATFIYSEWATQMNMGEKEMLEFDREANYNFELLPTDGNLELEKALVDYGIPESGQYFVAYSKDAEASATFEKQYQEILISFSNQAINSQMVQYGANDFKVIFSADTFDFRYMEQFEPRDGFWFYQKGQEPLDLGADEPLDEILEQAHSYFLGPEM